MEESPASHTVDRYDELVAHLHALRDAPNDPGVDPVLLDADLFDHVELQVSHDQARTLAPTLLPLIVEVLRLHVPAGMTGGSSDKQPADVLASMAQRLVAHIPFRDMLHVASEADLIEALGPDAHPALNLLAMDVMRKAGTTQRTQPPTDDDPLVQLAGMRQLLVAFITRWLASPDVRVGERGTRVLGDLLDLDCKPQLPMELLNTGPGMSNGDDAAHTATDVPTPLQTEAGHGFLWDRFTGRLVQSSPPPTMGDMLAVATGTRQIQDFAANPLVLLVAALCNGKHPETSHARQQSLAQDRLLRLLPRLAVLDFRRTSHDRDGGLLYYASDKMLQVARSSNAEDELVLRTRGTFFKELVATQWHSDRKLRAFQARVERETVADRADALEAEADYRTRVIRAVLQVAVHNDPQLGLQLYGLLQEVEPRLAPSAQIWLDRVLPWRTVQDAQVRN